MITVLSKNVSYNYLNRFVIWKSELIRLFDEYIDIKSILCTPISSM